MELNRPWWQDKGGKMKTKLLLIVSILLLLGLNACSSETSTGNAVQETFEDTTDDGVQDIQLSYGKVGPSYNYKFSTDTVKVGEPVRITADVDTLKGCYRYIQVPEYDISKYVTNSDNTVEFTPTQAGEILFTCSMGMGTATLTAVE